MIYVLEKSIDKFVNIMTLFASVEPLDAVVWLRPPVDAPNPDEAVENPKFLGYPLFLASHFNEEQPTDFFDISPERTERIKFSNNFIVNINNNFDIIEEECDSISLYYPGIMKWAVCIFFTENIILVRDEIKLEEIQRITSNCSLVAPSWW